MDGVLRQLLRLGYALRDGFAMVETLCAIAAAEVYEIEVTGQEIKGGRIRLIDIKSIIASRK